MAEIKSESVVDFIPESVADLLRNQQTCPTRRRTPTSGRSCVEVSGMLGERFRHCEYAATCPECGDTRASGEYLVKRGKAGDRHRAVPARHGRECRVEVGAKIEPATDATKADDLGTY
jgi:hypothetical protein